MQVIRNNKSKNIVLEIFPIKDRVIAALGWSENFNNSIPKIKSLENNLNEIFENADIKSMHIDAQKSYSPSDVYANFELEIQI